MSWGWSRFMRTSYTPGLPAEAERSSSSTCTMTTTERSSPGSKEAKKLPKHSNLKTNQHTWAETLQTCQWAWEEVVRKKRRNKEVQRAHRGQSGWRQRREKKELKKRGKAAIRLPLSIPPSRLPRFWFLLLRRLRSRRRSKWTRCQ